MEEVDYQSFTIVSPPSVLRAPGHGHLHFCVYVWRDVVGT